MIKKYDTKMATGAGLMGRNMPVEEPEQMEGSPGRIPVKGLEDYQISDEALKEIKHVVSNTLTLMHSDQERPKIMQKLRQKNKTPQAIVAEEANRIYRMLELSAATQSRSLNEISMSVAASLIVNELADMGEEASFFNMDQNQREAALQLAMQIFMEDGIRNGRIDATKLQQELDPLLKAQDPKLYDNAMKVAKQAGLQTMGGNA